MLSQTIATTCNQAISIIIVMHDVIIIMAAIFGTAAAPQTAKVSSDDSHAIPTNGRLPHRYQGTSSLVACCVEKFSRNNFYIIGHGNRKKLVQCLYKMYSL